MKGLKRASIKMTLVSVVAAAAIATAPAGGITSEAAKANDTGINLSVKADDSYINWEGVSNVSEFLDKNGNYCFAYHKGKTVTIVKSKGGKVRGKVKIKLRHPKFGAVTCDSEGNYYVVSGKTNKTPDTSVNTIFVSKYNAKGRLLGMVGDNGKGCFGRYPAGSFEESYYSDYSEFYTKEPFSAGNCDIAVNGNYIAVNYAREMYSGHQSNTCLVLNRNTMQIVPLGRYYNSHSFAQRAIPHGDGFILASEGDAYNRAFSVAFFTPAEKDPAAVSDDTSYGYGYFGAGNDTPAYESAEDSARSVNSHGIVTVRSYDIFHFWIKKNSSGNMYIVNNNYAHLGGIASADENHVALVGTSVRALDSKADSQKECLFIQIFDPTRSLNSQEAFVPGETRSGSSGVTGTVKVTDYGIKWLTNGSYTVANPQVVADRKGRFVVLFEKYNGGKYDGVYYTIINKYGKTVKKISRYSKDAHLNPGETPKLSGGSVYWSSNKSSGSRIYTYRLKVK